jgi:hypothetical protein
MDVVSVRCAVDGDHGLHGLGDLPNQLDLDLTQVDIPAFIERQLHTIPDDVLLNRDFTRLVGNILGSVARAGTEREGFYPQRSSLGFTDLFNLLGELWRRQQGKCSLCNGVIVPGEENPLLKMSVDRINSEIKRYDADNAHLTHVGCNLAKSFSSVDEWQDFLDVVRNAPEPIAPPLAN